MTSIFQLHPGFAQTIRERIMGGARDMTPQDWKGLRDGFLKWTLEEEAEPEHVTGDSVLRLALDRAPVGTVKIDLKSRLPLALDRDSTRTKIEDSNGTLWRLEVEVANISKATVNPYRGEEIPNWKELGLDPYKIYQLLRDPEELKKAVPSANMLPLLRKHKPVSADDPQQWDIAGTTGSEAKFVSPYLQNGLSIWTREGIDGVESNLKRELSCGYAYRADMTPGTFEGVHFDGIMRDLRFNHLALVEDGRAGPDVIIGDSSEEIRWGNLVTALMAI